ncbi:MAG: DUF1844 domain-containing protein [Candidatus Omnitrophica bacterium]|nr:DUF1844 domain-containing protein [Candidatus Omnitrophota bacterium]
MTPDSAFQPGSEETKKVDESWKESIRREKDFAPFQEEKTGPLPQPTFSYFASSLGMQALAALGEIADPASGAGAVHLDQARYLIDILEMLCEKTKGNLAAEEENFIENLLYELRMKFVQKSQKA